MKQDYWEQFTESGRVEDYLSYRGMSVCRDASDRYECKDTCKKVEYSTEGNGERNSESVDNGDRHDPVRIADRRI